MKKTPIKLIILFILTAFLAQSQEVKIEYDRTDMDTSDVIQQTVKLRVVNFPSDKNRCELINAFATDVNNQKITPEYFLTQANREFWITFEQNKKSKKLSSINGKVRFFTISKEAETIIEVDRVLEKINKTIYSKNDIKIIVLDLESLVSKKEKNLLEYKTEVASIIKDNKLNQKWFEDTLKKSFENYYKLYNMMIYCEDTKNRIDDIDSLFTEYSKYPEGVKNNFVKTFLFSRSDSTNMARISIKDPKTFNEIDFKELILDED
ncbi:hypothetical protein [Flavobacterium sp.]|uniref:hypothetical protein n=1 Tax=Flavobacterium sp. TaxID=239 RepID=UPI0026351CF0|nr:hypothetical protein [Flavobacterium sp.]